MNIIDGKKVASDIRDEIENRLDGNPAIPGLAVILVGNDEGSHAYVKLKKAAAEQLGMQFSLYKFPENVTVKEIEETIDWLNHDTEVDGILIQLPLPSHLDENALIRRIDPEKDADGFHEENIRQYLAKNSMARMPGLIEGVIRLLEEPAIPLAGKKAVILANSNIFADPMQEALKRVGVEASVALKPHNPNLLQLENADIIISAIGKKYFISHENINPDAIIIDVGYTREDNRVFGDVNPEFLNTTDVWLTPVPGGVGPVTVAMLLLRVLDLYEKHHTTQ